MLSNQIHGRVNPMKKYEIVVTIQTDTREKAELVMVGLGVCVERPPLVDIVLRECE